MRSASVVLASTHLILAACAPEQSADPPQRPEAHPGETIVLRSNVRPAVVALYLDRNVYLNHGNVSEVGNGKSDVGGALAACGQGVTECVEFAGLYIMAPPPTDGGWYFGGYEFQLVADGLDNDGHVVVASRDGQESYSYNFSPRCGVGWINFSTGREGGKEVFYPVGRSLFSGLACVLAPDA